MAEKILIVDDDPDTLKFLSIFLQKQGYETFSAPDGMVALRLAHEQKPDLIILDVMMPGMDGFEVARNLRRHPDTALTPILMFTARTQVQDKLAGYESGVDIYLTKPSHPVEMQANIKALLTQSKARREKQTRRGYLVGVLAAKGGLGVSTMALNTAIALGQTCKKKVIAAELRPGLGVWRDELGVTSNFGLENLLQMPPVEITPEAVEKQLFQAPFNVPLLLASSEPRNELLFTAAGQYEMLLETLGQMTDLVVLDIGTCFHPFYETFVRLCDEIVLVTEPQTLSLRRTRHLAADLRTHDFGSARPLTLVSNNRVRADMTMSFSKMEDALGQSVLLGITPVPELAFLSADKLAPFYIVQPGGVISKQFDTLAETICRHITR
jgi:CheY-like chemotaxis protein/MinD-like ATPase involved in chromosome partitioning or flagellar assembly